jgi:hypothetical protein
LLLLLPLLLLLLLLLSDVQDGLSRVAIRCKPRPTINQSINVTPVAMKLKKLMPAIH